MKTTTDDAEMTSGSVVSEDGTPIGFLRIGDGPAVVLIHGSNESARSHTQLALALADAFTVYLPDRRGRGLSGAHRAEHSIRSEVQDLKAVLAESNASRVFGVSVGALIALEAARTLPAIRQIAAYEPALLAQPDRYTAWVCRFDEEMAQGDTAAALVTSLYGLDLAPTVMKVTPRPLLKALTEQAMRSEDKKASNDTVTMRKVAPTLRYEGLLLAEMAGTAGSFANVDADVLFIGGSMKRPAFIRPAFETLAQTLPHNRCVLIPGLGHGGSSDVGPANRGGQPQRVAPVIRSFFAGDD
jgi:pimeloyl-ACP methyl ester carboxylesterase